MLTKSEELQSIVDALASRLARPVAIDDAHLQRVLAFSSHPETVDRVRRESILQRRVLREARAWVFSLGIAKTHELVRLPENPELGMDPRVCAPIRFRGQLLGFLWISDPGGSLGDEQLRVVSSAAEAAAAELNHQRLLKEIERSRERELLRDLLSDRLEVRRHAARELVEADLFVASGAVVAVVLQPLHESLEPDDSVRVSMSVALESARRSLSPRHCNHLVRLDHGLLIAAAGDPALRGREPQGLGKELAQACDRELAGAGWSALVGFGDPAPSLEDSFLSYDQARRAASVGGLVRTFGNVVGWSELGAYRILSRVSDADLGADLLPPGLVQLLDRREGPALAETLERYLDRAGDVKATAQDLHIHRGTLYYRLHRIEEFAHVDLSSGDDRLVLHLGLKLARLMGRSPVGEMRPRRQAGLLDRPSNSRGVASGDDNARAVTE